MASPAQEVGTAKASKKPPLLTVPDSDFYQVTECLNEAERDMRRDHAA
jgi:hypothetical protein